MGYILSNHDVFLVQDVALPELTSKCAAQFIQRSVPLVLAGLHLYGTYLLFTRNKKAFSMVLTLFLRIRATIVIKFMPIRA